MKIVKVNVTDLKELENSPIMEERSPASVPVILINENNEILFGSNSIYLNQKEDGFVECIQLEGLDNMESRKISFAMHYLGITCVVGYKNFNSMDKICPALEDLYLWNTKQFEDAKEKERILKNMETEDALF